MRRRRARARAGTAVMETWRRKEGDRGQHSARTVGKQGDTTAKTIADEAEGVEVTAPTAVDEG